MGEEILEELVDEGVPVVINNLFYLRYNSPNGGIIYVLSDGSRRDIPVYCRGERDEVN